MTKLKNGSNFIYLTVANGKNFTISSVGGYAAEVLDIFDGLDTLINNTVLVKNGLGKIIFIAPENPDTRVGLSSVSGQYKMFSDTVLSDALGYASDYKYKIQYTGGATTVTTNAI